MNNVVLNMPTIASNQIEPYTSNRAVDGDIRPANRWLAKSPCSLTVDLMGNKWVDRWLVLHMGYCGFNHYDYNNNCFSLQGSVDNNNWFELDSVADNTASITDKTFEAKEVRYLKLSITHGINVNPQFASVCELAVYEAAPTSSLLKTLIPSNGVLTPNFESIKYDYSIDLAHNITEIAFVPTSMNDGIIKINGYVVNSGETSQAIALVEGENHIEVEVTAKIGGKKTNYHITVTREKGSNLYLKEVKLDYVGRGFTESKMLQISHGSESYTSTTSTKATSVKLTPTAEDASVSIKVNGETVSSGSLSSSINLSTQYTEITIIVSKSGTAETKTYTITVERG